ncbi:hypothetical protein NLI96_g12653 [Meripilus lineatus]|uniref:GAG-pre-integrase domain-containing protein n=1 Tax=Meripilus lineatus TaxID=2056292 RepID=A0AAD5YC71_9APHY|nr:hypothetical protein NLI96_g12653 [Physisporinus lineatus]
MVTGKESKPKVADKVEEWERHDKDARTQITLMLDDKPLNRVLYATTAKGIWDKLKAHYEGKGKQTIAYLIQDFFRDTLSDDSPLEPQLNAMRQKAYILYSLGVKLDNALIAISMIISLPKSYSTLCTILMATEDEIKTDTVVAQILNEEKSRRDSNAATTLIAKTDNKSKVKKDAKWSKKCDHCKKCGHLKAECRKLKAENEAKEKGSTELTAKIATISDSYGDLQVFMAMLELLAANTKLSNEWIIDSGASVPMSSHRDWFQSYQCLSNPKSVRLGDAHPIPAPGIGTICLHVRLNDGTDTVVTMQDVYYIPDLHGNLLSVSHFTESGGSVNFAGNTYMLIDMTGKVSITTHKQDSLYVVNAKAVTPESAYITILDHSDLVTDPSTALVVYQAKERVSKADLATWHCHLGHINVDTIRSMLRKGLVTGGEIIGNRPTGLEVCQPCLEGKQTRTPIAKDANAMHPRLLHRVSSDVCSPMQTQTHQGFRYFITHLDAKSHFLNIQLMKTKDETFHAA